MLGVNGMTWLLVKYDTNILHVEIELEMTWITCIEMLGVNGIMWLLVKDDTNILHVEIELEMTWIACIKKGWKLVA
jgi:hypothetical protein